MGYLDNTGLAYLWEKIKSYVDGKLGAGECVFYGTCATAAATQAKVVDCDGFASSHLVAGTMLSVKFTYAQTYNGGPKLNVNSTGAVTVAQKGTTAGYQYMWWAGEVVTFVYDGTYWVCVDAPAASTTYYGVTKLSSSTASTSTSLAATPYAVKAAYDLADGKQDALVSGTNIKTINGTSLLGSGDISVSGGSDTVETIYDDASWTILKYGHVIMVQCHGYSGTATTSAAKLAGVLADYKPAYNISTTILTSNGGSTQAARMVVYASDGGVYIVPAGYSSSASWYGTLTYIY